MKVFKALIAEDEPILRGELKDTLAKLWPELVICAEAEDGIEAVRALDEHSPDIVFLDIHMPGMSGIEVAQQIGGRAHVAFVTAYDNHTLAAFEQGAVDYVMKPISPARIATTVARLKQRVKSAPGNLDGILQKLAQTVAPREYLRWLTASKGDELQLITVDEICYFKPDGADATATTATFSVSIHKSIAELSAALDPALFIPIDQSTLVNVNAIARLERDGGGSLRVQLKERTEELGVDAAHELSVSLATGIPVDTPDDHRMLATILFTDIVDSTATATRLGDRAWRKVLTEHDGISRKAIERFHGRLIKSMGDGVLATFDGPARAIRCAMAIGVSLRGLGIALRAGVHTGECELRKDDVGGIAVHIGARIASLAGPGEVLVSSMVRDLVGGSGIEFEDRGMHAFKGVGSQVRVFAAAVT